MDTEGVARRVLNARPLVLAAAAFALGIVLGRYFLLQTVYIIAAAVTMAVAVCFYRRKVFWLVCVATVFFAAFLSASAYAVDYLETKDGMRVSGRVYAQPYQNDYGSTIYLLDNVRIDGTPCGSIKLYADEDAFACGDCIKAIADVEIPKGVRNPGGFDEKLYLLAQGVHYKAYAESVEKAGTQGGPAVFFTGTRMAIADTVDRIFEPDIAPVAKAMLLGDKQGLDEQTYSAFKDAGVAHVLAVSGLHAGILIAFVYYLLRLLRAGENAPAGYHAGLYRGICMCDRALAVHTARIHHGWCAAGWPSFRAADGYAELSGARIYRFVDHSPARPVYGGFRAFVRRGCWAYSRSGGRSSAGLQKGSPGGSNLWAVRYPFRSVQRRVRPPYWRRRSIGYQYSA